MTKQWVGKSVAGVVVGAVVFGGIAVGAGPAAAKIESGFYKLSTVVTGGPSFTPTSAVPSNARVIGDRLYYDESGVGPWNANQYVITPTRTGGVVTPGGLGDLIYRAELRKTRTGYKGPLYLLGFPYGKLVLRKVDRSTWESARESNDSEENGYGISPETPDEQSAPAQPESRDQPES